MRIFHWGGSRGGGGRGERGGGGEERAFSEFSGSPLISVNFNKLFLFSFFF